MAHRSTEESWTSLVYNFGRIGKKLKSTLEAKNWPRVTLTISLYVLAHLICVSLFFLSLQSSLKPGTVLGSSQVIRIPANQNLVSASNQVHQIQMPGRQVKPLTTQDNYENKFFSAIRSLN